MTWVDPDPAAEGRYRTISELSGGPSAVPELIEALFDESWRVRRLAAERLGSLGHPDALVAPLLEVLTRRGQPGARNAAATALSHLGGVAVAPLVRLLRDVDPDQRKFAADILGELGLEAASPALIDALTDDDPNVRVAAAEALGKTGGPLARAALEALLARTDPLLQVSALEALTALDAPPPLPALVPLVAHPLTRRSAWRLMGHVRHRSAWVLVVQHLRAKATRDAALLALGSATASFSGDVEAELALAVTGVDDALAWLARCLGSEDLERRVGALHLVRAAKLAELSPKVAEAAEGGAAAELCLAVLSSLGTPGLVALVEGTPPALLAMSREGRAVAGEALVENATPRFVPALTALLDAGEAELAEVAVRALGRTQCADAIAPLLRALDDDGLSAAAARALTFLAQTYPADVRSALSQRVERAPLQPHLVRAWANVAGHEALPVLRQAMHHESDAVRAAAAQVAMVAPAGAAGLLGMAVVDESARVRRGAARAVSGLQPSEGRALLERLLDDREPSVLSLACTAAMERGAEWAAPRLRALVTHADAGVVLAAVQAAMVLGAADDALLTRALAHPDGEVVKQVLTEGASSRAVVEAAAWALSDPRWDVRAAAARTLEVGGGPEHVELLEAAAQREADPLAHQALLTARTALGAR
ncbi:MAG: HEAT repeat domain-containing protein [Myxococcaceae bacterium]|nr:HEAT repeat domain-containing protein [Myxococcaceae bacterium]